jgi:hypothetical protein
LTKIYFLLIFWFDGLKKGKQRDHIYLRQLLFLISMYEEERKLKIQKKKLEISYRDIVVFCFATLA